MASRRQRCPGPGFALYQRGRTAAEHDYHLSHSCPVLRDHRSLGGGGSSTFNINTDGHGNPSGTATVTFESPGKICLGPGFQAAATSGVGFHAFIGALTPSFTLSQISGLSVQAGASAAQSVTVTTNAALSGTLSASTSGYPAGITATLPGITLGPSTSASATLTVQVSGTVAAGAYTGSIIVTVGGVAQTVQNVGVTVSVTPDFTLTSSPTQYAIPGTSPSATESVSASGGFSQNVSLSCSNCPAGISVTFNPTSVTPNGSTQLAFNVPVNTPPGTYSLTVQGTAGSVQHPLAVSIYVADVTQVYGGFLSAMDDGSVYAFFTTYFIGSDADLYSADIAAAWYGQPNGVQSAVASSGYQVGSTPTSVSFPPFSLPQVGWGTYSFHIRGFWCDPYWCGYAYSRDETWNYPQPTLSSLSPGYILPGNLADIGIFGTGLGAPDEGVNVYRGITSVNVSPSGVTGTISATQSFVPLQPTGQNVSATMDATGAPPGSYQVSLTVFGYTTNPLSLSVDDSTPYISGVLLVDTSGNIISSLPQGGQAYIELYGSGFGSTPGTVAICPSGSNPCNSSDISVLQGSGSFWSPVQVNIPVATSATSQGTYDVQLTSLGASGNGFLQAPAGGNSAQSNRAQVGIGTVVLSLSKLSLTQVQATATPAGGQFSESVTPLSATGSITSLGPQGNVTVSGNSQSTTFSLTDPPNPSPTGAPSQGGMGQIAVTYNPSSGPPQTKNFNVATFGMSCYFTALETDWGTPPNSCQSVRISPVTYQGVASPTPPNLTGTHCASFIAEVRLQGSGVLADGVTQIQYAKASGEYNVVSQINAHDGTPPQAGKTLARDLAAIPGKGVQVSLDGLPQSLLANDTGGGINGYRLDYYGGVGKAVCTGSNNENNNPILVGACSPGVGTCPANFAQ